MHAHCDFGVMQMINIIFALFPLVLNYNTFVILPEALKEAREIKWRLGSLIRIFPFNSLSNISIGDGEPYLVGK